MNRKAVIKRILFGAFTALIIISLFVFSVREPDPDWGKYWMLRPLVLTPLAGALGGLFLSAPIMTHSRKTPVKVLVTIFGILAFLFILWIGVVLGLDGTLWN